MSFEVQTIESISPLFQRIGINPTNGSPCWLTDWMELLLKKIAINKLGPTVTSRWLYIASVCVYNVYQNNYSGKHPIDLTYWNGINLDFLNPYFISDQVLVEITCRYLFPLLIRNYMNLSLSELEVKEVEFLHQPYSTSNLPVFILDQLYNAISTYLQNRDNDGWKNTFIFNGTLPNGSNTINASNTESQNLNTLPQPDAWTPLSIGGKVKSYLTPEWGTANKGVLNDEEFQQLLQNASELYPSHDVYVKESKEVEQITSTLTPLQKITAEFWAGGPNTVTPPGMWFVFCDLIIRSEGMTIDKEVTLYTLIANGLYQASICAWRLKRDKLQARPIQKIRQADYQTTISSWNGIIQGEYWLPYQELNFVTPPFPDFVSGHSTFSATSARLIANFLGNDVIQFKKQTITMPILQYLSPILKSSQTVNFSIGNVFIYPRTSTVQQNVPETPLTLQWNRWSDMAKDSGRSRIYGGIHVESSNQAGLFLGGQIADLLWSKLSNL